MQAEAPPIVDWEGRLLRWSNLTLEASVLYVLLWAIARPREDGSVLLPLLAALSLVAAYSLRSLLDAASIQPSTDILATVLAGLAWSLLAARLCAPPGYWQADAERWLLVLGAMVGVRDGAGVQPLAFWSCLLLWWRGQMLPGWNPGFDEALGRLRLSAVVVAGAVGLASMAEAERGQGLQLDQLLVLTAFLVSGLLTTGLGRRRDMAGGAVPAPQLDGNPLGRRPLVSAAPLLVIMAAAVVLALAAFGADLLSPSVLSPLVGLAGDGLTAPTAAVAAIIQYLTSLWPTAPPTEVSAPQPTPAATGSAQPNETPRLPPLPWLGPALMGLMTLVGLLFAAYVFMLARSSLVGRGDDGIRAVDGSDGEGPAPIEAAEPTTIMARLVRLFHLVLRRPRRRGRKAIAVTHPAAQAPATGIATIRAAYRAFLVWAAAQGCARRPDETPDEFRRRLVSAQPVVEHEARVLTELYVVARYGGRTGSAAELQQAEAAIRTLERSGEN